MKTDRNGVPRLSVCDQLELQWRRTWMRRFRPAVHPIEFAEAVYRLFWLALLIACLILLFQNLHNKRGERDQDRQKREERVEEHVTTGLSSVPRDAFIKLPLPCGSVPQLAADASLAGTLDNVFRQISRPHAAPPRCGLPLGRSVAAREAGVHTEEERS